ncbi:hypothetical protein ACQ4PT_053392 [Festuca glaucescens]
MEQTPFMKAMHEFAMADPENCDREWAACVALAKEKMAAPLSSPTSSTSPLHHQARASTAVTTAPSATRSTSPLRAQSGSASSEPAPATPAPTSASAVSAKDDLTPGARRIYDYLVGNSDYLDGESSAPVPDTSYAELEAVHGAVDNNNSGLATVMPTNCSSECPSDGTYASVSMTISSATPNSPMTTCGVVPKLAEPMVSDKALDMDIMGDTSPMAVICLLDDLDDSADKEDIVDMSLGSGHVSFVLPVVFEAMAPYVCLISPYEDAVRKNPLNYDVWFDYLAHEESVGSKDSIRDVYERAIANVPPAEEKRYWQRYIYLWINCALYEELDAQDMGRAREVYRECLKQIPHNKFTFSKVWIMAAQLEIRRKDLTAARQLLGNAIGMSPKGKIFKKYIEIEMRLGNVDRCRTLYQKYIEWSPANCYAWRKYAELERQLGETDRAWSIYELAVAQPALDMPEFLLKDLAEFDASAGLSGIDREINAPRIGKRNRPLPDEVSEAKHLKILQAAHRWKNSKA